MRPSEYADRQVEYNKFLRSIQIAIYGYYDPQNRVKLRKLKQFLIDQNFNAKMAEDYECSTFPVSYQEDALKSSAMLYDSSEIHIYVVTLPIEVERSKLLDSLSMEYGWAWKDKQEFVGVYFEKNYDVSTLPAGAIHDMSENWNTWNFSCIEEIFPNVLRYCEHVINQKFRLFINL